MGLLASLIPPGFLGSIQESAFDLAYIDDTSQSEAEGLFADGGAPIAEADAFKAWGKSIAEGYDDCMKAAFAFDWAKQPEDCVDGLHVPFSVFNATNLDAWVAGGTLLEMQEVGALTIKNDGQKVEADTGYWDETGKARFRMLDLYENSRTCDKTCDDFAVENTVFTLNIWYGILADIFVGDGWVIAFALEGLDQTNINPTLKAYLDSTASYPMDPHSALPFPTRVVARIFDIVPLLFTPNAAVLGKTPIANNLEYTNIKNFLWNLGASLLKDKAPAYGVSTAVSPLFIKTSASGILGWGAMPIWVDPLSGSPFTFNFICGASGRKKTDGGGGPGAYVEVKMSSAFYHEGLGYVTQHYEANPAPTTGPHACGWDPDCAPAGCEPTATCKPESATGFDGGKIPGTYFGSAKGQAGVPGFPMFVPTYYMQFQMKSMGKVVVAAKYAGPNTDEGMFDFEGFAAMSTFKTTHLRRRLENCEYTGGRDTGGGTIGQPELDSQGQDCNSAKDTLSLKGFMGIPIYFTRLPRDFAPPGWEPDLSNLNDGPNSSPIQAHFTRIPCTHKFCSEKNVRGGMPSDQGYYNPFHAGYEPTLGVMIDVNFVGCFAWKLQPLSYHPNLAMAWKMVPLLWANKYLVLPQAINVDLAKLQLIPATLNGVYMLLLGQCAISLVGGFACCFCGV